MVCSYGVWALVDEWLAVEDNNTDNSIERVVKPGPRNTINHTGIKKVSNKGFDSIYNNCNLVKSGGRFSFLRERP